MKSFVRKTTLLILECLTVLIIMISVGAGVLMWRLQQGPIAVDFVRSILADRVSQKHPGVSLTFDAALLTWPDWREPLIIEIKNLQLTQDGEMRLRLPDAAISIARIPLMFGQIKPVAAIFRQPDFRFIRTEDNRFLLMSAMPGQDGQPVAPTIRETTDITGIIALLHSFASGKPLADSAHNAPAWPAFLAEFEAIQVKDAVILFEDEQGNVDWALPHVNAEMRRTGDGLEANILSRMAGEATMVTTLSALPDRAGGLSVAARANNFLLISPLRSYILAATNRTVDFTKTAMDASLNVNFTKDAHITLASGTLNIPKADVALHDVLPTTLTVSDGQIGFDYQSAAHEGAKSEGTLSLRPSRFYLNDVPVSVEGELKRAGNLIQGPLRAHMTNLPIKTLHDVWPLAIKETEAGIWLTQKMIEGLIEEASFSLVMTGTKDTATTTEAEIEEPDDLDLTLDDVWLETGIPVGSVWQWGATDITADYRYADLTLDYEAPLTRLTQASGIGSYKDETLNVGIIEGKLNDITVRKGNVMIDQIETKGVESNVVLTLPVSGPLSGLMAYLSLEPVGLEKDLLADPQKVAGTFDATTIIRFPAIYDLTRDRIDIEVDGTAANVTWPDAAIGLPLRDGTLDIAVKGGQLNIKGKGRFDTAPTTFDWTRSVNPAGSPDAARTALKASMQSDDALRAKMGLPSPDSVKGTVPLDLTYSDTANGNGEMTIAADLTQAAMNLELLGYTKTAGKAAKGKGTLVFTQEALTAIRDITLDVPDLTLDGAQLTLRPARAAGSDPELQELRIARFKTPSQDFNLRLTRPQSDLYDIDITATTFDGRPFLDSAPPVAAQKGKVPAPTPPTDDPMRYDVSLRTPVLRTTGSQTLQDVTLSLLTARDDSLAALNLNAKAQGSTVNARFDPPNLSVSAANAGHALRALGIYDTIMGGRMLITAKAANGNTTAQLQGETVIDDFTVVKAPALAQLLNILSLSGIGNLLDNKGIHFKRLQTAFTWTDTLKQKSVAFQEGRTSGASLGLTFEGDLNRLTRTLDVRGTIIPMSEVNKLIGNIPIIGNILLGGKNGSLIAATYTLRGGYDDPKVMINPLSVLTPGFIRTILFEHNKKAVTPSAATPKGTTLND
ncbi:MAG: DUF3971 domain-containing protein [Pseudomonadota bacterium]